MLLQDGNPTGPFQSRLQVEGALCLVLLKDATSGSFLIHEGLSFFLHCQGENSVDMKQFGAAAA